MPVGATASGARRIRDLVNPIEATFLDRATIQPT